MTQHFHSNRSEEFRPASIYQQGGNAAVMVLCVLGAFGLGWATLLLASAANLPLLHSLMANPTLVHGVALLAGVVEVLIIRRSRAGRLFERLARRLVFRTLWVVGDASGEQ